MTGYYERNREKWDGYRAARRERAPQCVVAMCDDREEALGFCFKHYKRWKRHGVLYSPKRVAGLLRTPGQRSRDYYVAHRADRIAYQRERREADLAAARASEREVYRRRRGKHRAESQARERRMERPDAATVEYDGILRRDPCSYCGARPVQVDHVEPVACGGRNHWTNLTAACRPCNRAKSTDSLLSFMGR